MTDCKIAQLSDRGVLRVAGGDAAKFLQGLVTNDIEGARDGKAIYAGLLTPQGKILFDFFIAETHGAYVIDCAKAQTAELVKRLAFYKLRADVDIVDLSNEHAVWAAWGGTPRSKSALVIFSDPRLCALGHRAIAPDEAGIDDSGCTSVDASAYHAHRISLGVPEGGRDFAYGDAFPHEAGLDQLKGVDFEKGCFVGQEVVSRMQHRGTARKRIVPLSGQSELASGAEILADGFAIGRLGSVSGNEGLALLRLDRAETALREGKTLLAGTVPVRLRQPEWATFKVPVSPSPIGSAN